MADLNIVIAAQTGAAQSEIARLQAKLKGLDGSLGKSRRGANQMGDAVGETTRGMSKFAKSGLQQTGYQLGDFAVQVGGGTSALTAFGQQGSQLLGIFGPFGAILGAAVAIVAALGNAYVKSTADTKDFAKASGNLSDMLAKANTEGGDAIGTYEDLRDKYKVVTPEVLAFANAQRALNAALITQATINAKTALQNFSKEISAAYTLSNQMNASFRGGVKDLAKLGAMIKSVWSNDLTDLGDKFGITESSVRKLSFALGDLSKAKSPAETLAATTAGLNAISEGTVAITDDQKDLVQVLTDLGMVARMSADKFKVLTLEQIEASREASRAFDSQKKLGEGVSSSFGSAFKSIIDGTKSTREAFKNMAASVVDSLIDVLIIQQLVGSVGEGGKNSGGTGLAGFFSKTGKAIGGSVQSGSTYMVGERGPELFMPNSSGSIIPNNKMGGGGGTTVVQNINISTGVSQTVRAEIAQLMPQIANSAKAAVLDAKQRGGSFSKAF